MRCGLAGSMCCIVETTALTPTLSRRERELMCDEVKICFCF